LEQDQKEALVEVVRKHLQWITLFLALEEVEHLGQEAAEDQADIELLIQAEQN
jgi:hypothetical protein